MLRRVAPDEVSVGIANGATPKEPAICDLKSLVRGGWTEGCSLHGTRHVRKWDCEIQDGES